jgi:hypothetical protein
MVLDGFRFMVRDWGRLERRAKERMAVMTGMRFQRRAERNLAGAGSAFAGLLNYGGQVANRGMRYAGGALDKALPYAETSPGQLAGMAGTDVRQAVARGQGATDRSLTRMGVNPNSGRFVGMRRQLEIDGAAAEAGAMNRARLQGRQQNFSNLMGVASAGMGMAGQGVGTAAGAASGMRAVAHDYGALAAGAAEDAATAPLQEMIDALLREKPVYVD